MRDASLPSGGQSSRKYKRRPSQWAVIIGFLLPAVAMFLAFVIFPIYETIVLSFHSWPGIFGANRDFVGFQNYRDVLQQPQFWNSMINVLYFLLGGFLVLMPLSFGLALLITSKLKFTRFMKTAFFMPVMLSVTAVALMWVYILNPTFGAFNEMLRALGLGFLAFDWLSTPTLNTWAVVMVNTWMFAGYNMLIFAAGLVAIPETLYEAAELDGCTGFKKIWHVSVPLSKQSFKVFSILCITGCIRVFDIVWAMTRGGPNRVSETPAIMLYNQAFSFRQFGASSAIGVILMIMGIVFSVVLAKAFKDDE